jgi:hypothetical protein
MTAAVYVVYTLDLILYFNKTIKMAVMAIHNLYLFWGGDHLWVMRYGGVSEVLLKASECWQVLLSASRHIPLSLFDGCRAPVRVLRTRYLPGTCRRCRMYCCRMSKITFFGLFSTATPRNGLSFTGRLKSRNYLTATLKPENHPLWRRSGQAWWRGPSVRWFSDPTWFGLTIFWPGSI